MKRATVSESTIVVSEIRMTVMTFNLVGVTPLMMHSASAHAKGELLFPSPKKNAAERAVTMKHEPFQEYVEASYRFRDADPGPTRLYMPAGAIHAALKDVAIDMVNTKKAQIGRLTSVPGIKLPVYGTSKIVSAMVRNSDQNRTPDIRTLPIFERWAMPNITIRFVNSLVKESSIANLLANAGIIIGIGDGRPQHGYFDFGQWRLAEDDDKELKEIMRTGGRAAQDKALAHPEYYDIETQELLEWFMAEQKKRAAAPPVRKGAAKEAKAPASPPPKKRNGKAQQVVDMGR
jgi:hypothetical protein